MFSAERERENKGYLFVLEMLNNEMLNFCIALGFLFLLLLNVEYFFRIEGLFWAKILRKKVTENAPFFYSFLVVFWVLLWMVIKIVVCLSLITVFEELGALVRFFKHGIVCIAIITEVQQVVNFVVKFWFSICFVDEKRSDFWSWTV